MTFFLFEGIWGFNELAKELENPFGPDANDVSLMDFHVKFVTTCREIKEAHIVKINSLRRQHGQRNEAGFASSGASQVAKASSILRISLGSIDEASTEEDTMAVTIDEGLDRQASHTGDIGEQSAGLRMPGLVPHIIPTSFVNKAFTESLKLHSMTFDEQDTKARSDPRLNVGRVLDTEGRSNPGLNVARVLDEHLVEITERIERHLAQMAVDIETMTSGSRDGLGLGKGSSKNGALRARR